MSLRRAIARHPGTSFALALAALGVVVIVGVVSWPSAPSGTSHVDVHDRRHRAAEELAERIAAVLRSSRSRDAPPAADISSALASEGPAAIEPLVAILVARRVPPTKLDRSEQVLSEPQRDLVLGALALMDRRATMWVTEHLLATNSEPGGRLAGIEILGVVGSAKDLPRIFALASSDDEEKVPASHATALRNACALILRREDDSFAVAWELLNQVAPPLRSVLVESLGTARDPRGLRLLGRILMVYPDLAQMVLAQVRLVGRSGDLDVDEALAEQVRWLLDPNRPTLCQSAALALGELHDFESIPQLIGLLGESSNGAGKNALWALQRMTGMALSATPEPWTAWHNEELRWFREDFPAIADRLTRPEIGFVAESVQAIAQHRYRCDRLAQELLVVLERDEPDLRALACVALSDLGSPVAIEPLTSLLDDPSDRVAASARAALVRIAPKEIAVKPPTRKERAAQQAKRAAEAQARAAEAREAEALQAAEDSAMSDSP